MQCVLVQDEVQAPRVCTAPAAIARLEERATSPGTQPQISPAGNLTTLPHTRSSPPPPNPDMMLHPRPPMVPFRPMVDTIAAITIPSRLHAESALSVHSTWGSAYRAGSAPPPPSSAAADAELVDGASPSERERVAPAAVGTAADRLQMEQFAAGDGGRSSRSSSPATDTSLRVASRLPSFNFVQLMNTVQQPSSPQQVPQVPIFGAGWQPTASAAPGKGAAPRPPMPAAPSAASAKPSPAAPHSFRNWAKGLDKTSPQPEADGDLPAPEAPPTASSPIGSDDIAAAKFLDAMGADHPEPAPSPFAAISKEVFPVPQPPPSPFNTQELQAATSTSDAQFHSAHDGSTAESPNSSQPNSSQAPSSQGRPQSGGVPSPDGTYARSDHDRHKELRSPSKWKPHWRRSSHDSSRSKDGTTADGQDGVKGSTKGSRRHRHKPWSSRCSNASEPQTPSEQRKSSGLEDRDAFVDALDLDAADSKGSSKPGLLRRVKDVLLRPVSGTGSRGSCEDPDSARSPSGPLKEDQAHQHQQQPPQPRESEAAHCSSKRHGRGTVGDSHSSRPDPGHIEGAAQDGRGGSSSAAREAAKAAHREERRSGRRKHRSHRERGRPGRHTSKGQDEPPEPNQNNLGLVMPWEGDPFWQVGLKSRTMLI